VTARRNPLAHFAPFLGHGRDRGVTRAGRGVRKFDENEVDKFAARVRYGNGESDENAVEPCVDPCKKFAACPQDGRGAGDECTIAKPRDLAARICNHFFCYILSFKLAQNWKEIGGKKGTQNESK
jgi:hypothetical protein